MTSGEKSQQNVCRVQLAGKWIGPARRRDAVSLGASTVFTTDFQSLSVFRIVFAVYLLGDYWTGVSPYFDDFFTNSGILPLFALASDVDVPVAIAIARVLEASRLPTVLPYVYPAALICFGIGYRTRLANGIVFVLNSYLFWRNPYILSGAEDVARLLLLWCLFLPMNRYWSIDAALDQQPRDRPYPRLPFAALRLQITSIYFFAGIFKLVGPAWRDGTAVAMVLQDNMYGGTSVGLYLVHNFPTLLGAVTYATIGLQVLLPLLIYSPRYNDLTRGFALASLAVMHLSFVLFLNIGGFPFVCLTSLILLIPDRWWNRLLRKRRARLARVTIFYEPDCGFCYRVSLLLREFLVSPTTAVQPASVDAQAHRLLTNHNSWVIRSADGTFYLKWHAVAYLLKQNPLLALLGWLTDLPCMRAKMHWVYDCIGAHRQVLGAITRYILPLRKERPIRAEAEIICGVLMWLALICNVMSLPWPGKDRIGSVISSKPAGRSQFFEALQVGQSWSLFAPVPTHYQHRYQVSATTIEDTPIELMEHARHPLFWEPDAYRVKFATHRWMTYFAHLNARTKEQLTSFGSYLCWWARRPDQGLDARLREVEIRQFILAFDEIWARDTRPAVQQTKTCDQARPQAHGE